MITPDFHPDRFGTDHDPILTGVASGLIELFPPIHNPGQRDPEGRRESTISSADQKDMAEG